MKIHRETAAGRNVIRAYETGRITVNQETYTGSLVVLPTQLIVDWRPARFGDLTKEDFDMLASLGAEVVLLGTGARLQFPAPSLTRALVNANIGLEVMDTGAACRTYNVLLGEGRPIAAALLPIF